MDRILVFPSQKRLPTRKERIDAIFHISREPEVTGYQAALLRLRSEIGRPCEGSCVDKHQEALKGMSVSQLEQKIIEASNKEMKDNPNYYWAIVREINKQVIPVLTLSTG